MASNPIMLKGRSVELTLTPHMFPDDDGYMDAELSAELRPDDQRLLFVETSVGLTDVPGFRKQLDALGQPGDAVLKDEFDTFVMEVTRTESRALHVDCRVNWRPAEGPVVAFSARYDIDEDKLADISEQVRRWIGR